jgi:hypothetical protein
MRGLFRSHTEEVAKGYNQPKSNKLHTDRDLDRKTHTAARAHFAKMAATTTKVESLDTALQNAVSSLFPEAQIIRQESIQSLWGGYGKIVRVHLRSDDEMVPATVVVKCVIPPQDEYGISHERKCKSYKVEQYFYDNYASKLDPSSCRVPKLLLSDTSNPNRTLFMLEDLDGIGYSNRRYNLSYEDAKLCVIWLANFHKTYLGSQGDSTSGGGGGGGVWDQGSYWHLDTRPDEFDAMDDRDILKPNARAIDSILRNAKYKTLLHGDAKLANFCWGSNDVAAVDFQYTGWGVGVIDLAYCIGKFPGVDKLSGGVESKLIDLYFEILSADPEVELEWRKLYCVAVADFERFLAGWGGASWNRKGDLAEKIAQALDLVV